MRSHLISPDQAAFSLVCLLNLRPEGNGDGGGGGSGSGGGGGGGDDDDQHENSEFIIDAAAAQIPWLSLGRVLFRVTKFQQTTQC